MDGRVHGAEVPLVRGELAVGMHVPLAPELDELALGEARIDQGRGDAMEGQVPGGEPRVLPIVGHRQDIGAVEQTPVAVAAVPSLGRRWRLGGVAVQPL